MNLRRLLADEAARFADLHLGGGDSLLPLPLAFAMTSSERQTHRQTKRSVPLRKFDGDAFRAIKENQLARMEV